jgi:hypothetical protein
MIDGSRESVTRPVPPSENATGPRASLSEVGRGMCQDGHGVRKGSRPREEKSFLIPLYPRCRSLWNLGRLFGVQADECIKPFAGPGELRTHRGLVLLAGRAVWFHGRPRWPRIVSLP